MFCGMACSAKINLLDTDLSTDFLGIYEYEASIYYLMLIIFSLLLNISVSPKGKIDFKGLMLFGMSLLSFDEYAIGVTGIIFISISLFFYLKYSLDR